MRSKKAFLLLLVGSGLIVLNFRLSTNELEEEVYKELHFGQF